MKPGKELSPKDSKARTYLQQALDFHNCQQFDAALASYDKAIESDPGFALAYLNRGALYININENELALADLDRAVGLNPALFDAWHFRGVALVAMKHFKAALESLEKALLLNPSSAEVYNNIGRAFMGNEQQDIALEYYEKALVLNPALVDACCNYATALFALGQYHAAIEWYDRTIALAPDYFLAFYSKAFPLLLTGRLEEGFSLYEYRCRIPSLKLGKMDIPGKVWLGEGAIQGKTILLCHEGGYGDIIQFCRYAKLVSMQGAKVILQVPHVLASLLANLGGVDKIIVHDEAPTRQTLNKYPPFDVSCSLMSLPLALKTTLETIPGETPYLYADPEKVAFWEKRLGEKTKPRVGLVWSGNPTYQNDHNRSILLTQLLPYLPDCCEYVSLQKEVSDIDRIIFAAMTEWKHYEEELEDFSDTAALCSLMDVVISVDTAVAHLSGALGKRTWIMLPFSPDWRWLLERRDTPWYPGMRLYRQHERGNWNEVFEEIRCDLLVLGGHESN